MNTTKQMKERGQQHFNAGKTLGLLDCAAIDSELYAETKDMGITEACRHYAKMRKAFNAGWFSAHGANAFAAISA